jgi:hypothetical protein
LKASVAATMPAAKPAIPVHRPLEMLAGESRADVARREGARLTAALPIGPHNVKLQITGALQGGAPFKRVVLRTMGVG